MQRLLKQKLWIHWQRAFFFSSVTAAGGICYDVGIRNIIYSIYTWNLYSIYRNKVTSGTPSLKNFDYRMQIYYCICCFTFWLFCFISNHLNDSVRTLFICKCLSEKHFQTSTINSHTPMTRSSTKPNTCRIPKSLE